MPQSRTPRKDHLSHPAPQSLGEFLNELLAARLYILGGLMIAGLCAAIFLFLAIPHYKASMIIAPASPMNGSETSSLMGDDNLFALRYLVQRVGTMGSNDFVRFENTYSGPSVSTILLADETTRNGLMKDKTFPFSRSEDIHTPAMLSAYIAKNVRLDPVGTSALKELSYRHPDPAFATYFLGKIHRVTDEHIRRNIKAEATERSSYLRAAIDQTTNPDHRRALTSLLMEQERLRMLVSVESPYAAAIIEPPAARARPAWPQAPLTLLTFLFAGALIGYAAFHIRLQFKNTGRQTPQNKPQSWEDILRESEDSVSNTDGLSSKKHTPNTDKDVA